MKIAIDCRKFDDFGIGKTIRGTLEGLASLPDDELTYLILGPASIADRLPHSLRFRFVEERSPHYSIRELVDTGKTAAEAGADLLHVPHYVTPFTRLPVVTTIHDLIHLRLPRRHLPLGGRLYARWMLGRATSRSARIVTVSNAVKREIERTYPRLDRRKIVVIPNGVAAISEPPVPLDQREPFILFAGNDKPHKNVDRLVTAFATVHQEFPRISLVLVGSPFERFRGIPGIEVRGFVTEDELVALYRRTTALLQPSLMEGFGLPVAEAMSHGTPVIVSSIPTLREVAGDAAIRIDDPLDVASIASTITGALGDEQLMRSSALLGPRIASRYSWSRTAESLVALWRVVLGITKG